jgi:hypothetical protein
MKQFFKQLFNKKQKTKIMIGKKVKLVKGSSGPSSSNNNLGNGIEYTLTGRWSIDRAWCIKDKYGNSAGWAYEWEMEGYKVGIEELEKELSEAQTKLDNIQFKIDWMKETGSDDFIEDEFKVYQTLKLLDNGKLSMIEKSKLIAELIKK